MTCNSPVDMDIYFLMTHSPFQIDALFQALRGLRTFIYIWKDFKVGRYVLPYCNQLFCSLLLLKGGSDLWGHCIFWVAGLSCDTSVVGFSVIMGYSNKCACTFISGKVCLLSSIKVRRQSLSKINVHARLFGTLEYVRSVAF